LLKNISADTRAAARVILTDWNNGKIPYFSQPPKPSDKQHIANHAGIELDYFHDFKLGKIFQTEKAEVIAGLALFERGHYIEIEMLGIVKTLTKIDSSKNILKFK